MKTKDWIYVAAAIAAFVLGALLFRGCQKPAQTIEVVKWRTVNLDSLKKTLPPDTVFLPGPAKQVLRYVTVTVTNQGQADSLAKAYAELANRYEQLETELTWGWLQGEGEPVEISTPSYTYTDSITTPDYFHRWEIVAEGPVVSYSPQIVPFCPIQVVVPPRAVKMHRVGAWMGMQTGAQLSPMVGISYRNRYFFTTAGYLPMTKAFQAGVGLDIGVR
jgi:hypothetical protein